MKLYKYIKILCVACLVFSIFSISSVSAKTLGELQNELSSKKKELDDNKDKKNLTESEMKTINNNIKTIQDNISQIQIDTTKLSDEINELNMEIIKKQDEIKDIMSYFQISSGESAYLEYVMGASDFTDFIYRTAVTEQMTSYNNELIDSYNATIKKNEEKKIELANKSVELKKQQESMKQEYAKLGEELSSIGEEEIIITDEVKSLQELVQIYVKRGCKANEDISTCGEKTLPVGTTFYRQLTNGYITSWFGGRDCSDPRVSCGHYGLDSSTSINRYNTPVYAIGTGMVASLTIKSSCGGNMVWVHHKLSNGRTYTSVYMHLSQINVSKGQTVTKDTVVGIMGGGSTTPWDYCTTGPHSHLGIATGLYGIDYNSSQLKNHYIDPTTLINYPKSMYVQWNDRYTAF